MNNNDELKQYIRTKHIDTCNNYFLEEDDNSWYIIKEKTSDKLIKPFVKKNYRYLLNTWKRNDNEEEVEIEMMEIGKEVWSEGFVTSLFHSICKNDTSLYSSIKLVEEFFRKILKKIVSKNIEEISQKSFSIKIILRPMPIMMVRYMISY